MYLSHFKSRAKGKIQKTFRPIKPFKRANLPVGMNRKFRYLLTSIYLPIYLSFYSSNTIYCRINTVKTNQYVSDNLFSLPYQASGLTS